MKRILVMIELLVVILRLDGQNVGIGVADPACRLDILAPNSNAMVGRFMSGGGVGEIQIGNGTKSLYLGANASGAFIASTVDDPMFFRNGGSVKMTLIPAGLLGIGTESPAFRLDVQSPGASSTVARFKTAGGISDIFIENGAQQLKIGVNDSSAYVNTVSGHDLRLQTGSQDRIFIDHSSGFTGINTMSPAYRLDVHAPTQNLTVARFKTPGGSAAVQVDNGTQQLKFGVHNAGAFIQTFTPHDLYIQTNNQDRIVIDHETGNVGIGTALPSKRLEVIGDIKLSGVIENEAIQSASLVNSWVNYGDGFETAGYYKDKQGVVRLHGLVKSGTDPHIMTLPIGYRPAKTHMFTIISGTGFARLDVHSNGNVVLVGSYSNAYVSLDGMAFRL